MTKLNYHQASQNYLKEEALNAWLFFAILGMKSFPVFGIRLDGSCMCDDLECKYPGKHPMNSDSFKSATANAKKIRSMVHNCFPCNVGIATGQISNIVVCDFDERAGGDRSKYRYENLYGRLDDTMIVRTGDGWHSYYRYPTGYDIISLRGVMPGLDIRANKGYVVGPMSVHSTFKIYRILNPKVPIAPLPVPMLKLILKHQKGLSAPQTGSSNSTGLIQASGYGHELSE